MLLKIKDLFLNSIWSLKLPFLASLLENFSTIYMYILSKFFNKSAQKFSIFSTKANFERSLKKRPLTLLEVLICFFLISIAVIPLIAPYRFMLQESDTKLKELDIDRKVPLYFVELLSKLYAKEISLKNLDEESVFPLPDKGEYRFVATDRGWVVLYLFKVKDKTLVYDFLLPKDET